MRTFILLVLLATSAAAQEPTVVIEDYTGGAPHPCPYYLANHVLGQGRRATGLFRGKANVDVDQRLPRAED
jgi:hypothetical protein